MQVEISFMVVVVGSFVDSLILIMLRLSLGALARCDFALAERLALHARNFINLVLECIFALLLPPALHLEEILHVPVLLLIFCKLLLKKLNLVFHEKQLRSDLSLVAVCSSLLFQALRRLLLSL